MAPRLKDEDYNKPKDNEHKKEDALPPASVLLVPVEHGTKRRRKRSDFNRHHPTTRDGHKPSGDFKLLYRLVHVDSRLLNVIFDAVKECALVYDE
jgi:hypothetical protein